MLVSSSDSSVARSTARRSEKTLLCWYHPLLLRPKGTAEGKQKQSELSQREGWRGGAGGRRDEGEEESASSLHRDEWKTESALGSATCVWKWTLNARSVWGVSGSSGRVSRFPHGAPTWISSYIKINRAREFPCIWQLWCWCVSIAATVS